MFSSAVRDFARVKARVTAGDAMSSRVDDDDDADGVVLVSVPR